MVRGLRLDSWKEIAAYLSRDVRTVVRWEKDRGLPVHRVPGGERQAVYAHAHELDSWLSLGSYSASGTPSGEGVAIQFEFPGPLKVACEQYLLYFAQFLRDLGVEVEAKIEERAKAVLFSVIPTDKNQALDKIREALDAYLQMPTTPDFGAVASQFPDVSVTQLRANVLHLQSQFMLAKATLEMKDAIIEVKDLEITLLKNRADFSNLKPQPALQSADVPDKEPIVSDVISVKKYEWKFLEINLPNLLRKLKRQT